MPAMNAPFYPLPANPQLRLLSLGAGVQSTTLALMAAHGAITPAPDCAIFADTGAEPRRVYDHLRWLMSGNVLPFPVHIASAGNLRDEILDAVAGKGNSWGRAPFFVEQPGRREGRLKRQCTGDYKIDPIHKKIRELIGLRPRQWWPKEPVIEQWIGFSMDEVIRVKPSEIKAIANRYPLLEHGMTRRDCYDWLEHYGYPVVRPHEATVERPPWPPRSACTFCPYRTDAEWEAMDATDPESWTDAILIDNAIRDGMAGVKAEHLYLHRSLKPLAEVDLKRGGQDQSDLFAEVCEGHCGVYV